MAAVLMTAVFPAGATVEFVRRLSSDLHVAGDVVAAGVVDDRSVLFVDGLEPGGYWAVCAPHGPVQVRAKEGVKAPEGERPAAPAAKRSRVVDAPPARESISGARTTGNARAKKARAKKARG